MNYENKKLEEFNQFLRNRKVAIIGLGVSNIPMLDYLHENRAKVTVFDNRKMEQIPKEVIDKITAYTMEFSFGENCLSKLEGFSLIIRSPSCLPTIPELVLAEEKGAVVTTEVELVMKMCPGIIIGVTGSDGKTTTTSMIYEILKKKGYSCYIGGNIGIPLFTKLDEMQPEDIVVLELSSFQLMQMTVSPHIAVITNITPNHLNIHSSYEEYIEAKKNIFKFQDEKGILVINYDNEITKDCKKEAKGKVIYFSSKEKLEDGYIVDNGVIKQCEDKIRKHLITAKELKIKGTHNLENTCAAIAATATLVDSQTQIQTIQEFNGVEHRIEFIEQIKGVKWYNDSIASTPTRTIAGLNSFEEEIVLIAGGYDKNLDYTPIAKPIFEHVVALIVNGQTSEKIIEAVKEEGQKQKKEIPIYICEKFEQTVEIANKIAKQGQVVFLSPASASFDRFKNFEEKGNYFKELVRKLKQDIEKEN